jgi:glycosyltransferase involved in cell wall biosynthesis
MITIGLQGGGYIEDRCVLRIPTPGIRMVRAYDALDLANAVQRRVFRPSHATEFLNCIHQGTGFPRVDGFHLVNAISLSRRPWITTFEHYLPRWNAHSRFGMKLVARKNCLAIVALSAYAHRSMTMLLEEHPDLRPRIEPKLHMLPPPQAPHITSFDEKPLDHRIPAFTFVGREFFRKGGMEILHAASILRDEGHTFRLNIISNLEHGDYVTHATAADVEKAKRAMAALGETVVFRGEMPNAEVMATLRASHAGLLPTFDDTYGFSVLEAQACGTPMITTDVCALGETNSPDVGWVIPLPQDRWGQAYRVDPENLTRLSAQVRDGLVAAMREIIRDPATVRPRGIRALERIQSAHDPSRHAATLVSLYRQFVPGP